MSSNSFTPERVLDEVDCLYSLEPVAGRESMPKELVVSDIIKLTEELECFAQLTGMIIMRDSEPDASASYILRTDKQTETLVASRSDIFVGPYASKTDKLGVRRTFPNAIGIWQLKTPEEV